MLRNVRRRVGAFFEDPNSRTFVFVNDFLAFVTIISVLAIVLETIQSLHVYHTYFKVIEYTSVFVFSLEYLGRLWVAKSRRAYIFSFFGIIDLLAIIPTFLALANFTFLKTSRALRILRFLRMLRLAKMARVHGKAKDAHSLYRLNIQIYVAALGTALLLLGTLFFIFEGHHAYARDIPTSMFWTFKVILGGIPFEQPASMGGLGILIAAKFVSLILLGLLLSLINTLTRKALIGSESDA